MSTRDVGRIPAKTVAESFIKLYYNILLKQPANTYKLYKDNSKLGRQDDNGIVRTTTTLEAINEKLLSMQFDLLKLAVLWIDAQNSIHGGVKVTVTGSMLGLDNSSRNFVQVFVLAPTENGYFVLNDILRFLDKDSPPAPRNDTMVNENKIPLFEFFASNVKTETDAMKVPLVNEVPNVETVVDTEEVPLVDEIPNVETAVDAEAVPLVDDVPNVTMGDTEEAPLVKIVLPNVEIKVDAESVPLPEVDEVPNEDTMVDTEEVPPVETVDEIPNVDNVVDAEEVPPVEEVPNVETVVNAEMALHLEVAVKAANDAEVPVGNVVEEVHDDSPVADPNLVPLAKISDELPDQSCMDESESKVDEAPNKSYSSTETGETSSSHVVAAPEISPLQPSISAAGEIPISAEADHDYSIYLKCLPMSVTPSILEDEFKRFGAIKNGGIQVKINKQGFCFGLLEFEEANSVQKALRASPVGIAGRQIVVEEKHPSYPRVGRGAHRYRTTIRVATGRGGMLCYFHDGRNQQWK